MGSQTFGDVCKQRGSTAQRGPCLWQTRRISQQWPRAPVLHRPTNRAVQGGMSAGDAQRAPDAASPTEFEPSGDAVCAADTPRQTSPSPLQPGAAPRFGLGAHLLAADFSGVTGRQGQAQLRRAAAALKVRRRAASTNAKPKEACQRAVVSQVTLHRYSRMPGQVPAPSAGRGSGVIAPAAVSNRRGRKARRKAREQNPKRKQRKRWQHSARRMHCMHCVSCWPDPVL